MSTLSIVLVNQTWLREELQQLGHRVFALGVGDGAFDYTVTEVGQRLTTILERVPFKPDILIFFDNSSIPWCVEIERVSIPKIFYSVDTHHHHAWHPSFGAACDLTLVAQKDYINQFIDQQIDARWFPGWAMREVVPLGERDIDVCFRGTLDPVLHPRRAEFFQRLSKLLPIDARGGDWALDYPRSRIVVNEVVRMDLNFRVFEALASGALLVTPEIGNGLTELFTDRVNIVLYERGNHEDAAQKVDYYLRNEGERSVIAENGLKLIQEHHSKEKRAGQLLQYIQEVLLVNRSKHEQYHYHLARCYLASASILRSFGSEVAVPFLLAAAANLEQSAKRREIQDSGYISAVLLCLLSLEEAELGDLSLQLLQTIRESYPDDVILALTEVERMISVGQVDEALRIAGTVSKSPEELLSQAADLLAGIRKQIGEQLESFSRIAEGRA